MHACGVFGESVLTSHHLGAGIELRWSGLEARAFTHSIEPSVRSCIIQLKGNFVSNLIRKDDGILRV